MCRWIAYQGPAIPISTLVTEPNNSLLDESMGAADPGGDRAETTNPDGFGMAFFTDQEEPGIFHTTQPAWSDLNVHNLCEHIDSRMFAAHVRAASPGMAVSIPNTHPFSFGRWAFVHNGEIEGWEKLHRDLLLQVDPKLFGEIKGTTDSELMFYLALTFGLDRDPIWAMSQMVTFVEKVGGMHDVKYPVNGTFGIMNGKDVYAFRYASHGEPPSLFHTNNPKHFGQINPKLAAHYSQDMRIIASEPIGNTASDWWEIPRGTAIKVSGFELETRRFRP
jgi:predicted glutamine amidotransferase